MLKYGIEIETILSLFQMRPFNVSPLRVESKGMISLLGWRLRVKNERGMFIDCSVYDSFQMGNG